MPRRKKPFKSVSTPCDLSSEQLPKFLNYEKHLVDPHPMIDSDENLEVVCCHLLKRDVSVLAMDTEFLEYKKISRLDLVQIGWKLVVSKGATYHYAFLVNPNSISPTGWAPLREVWMSPRIVKVLHGAATDITLLSNLLGGPPVSFVDTQILAGMCTTLHYPVGYKTLVSELSGVDLKKDKKVTRSDWNIAGGRRLGAEQVQYALDDVRYLVDVFVKLKDRAEALGRYQYAPEEMLRFLPSLQLAEEKAAMQAKMEKKSTIQTDPEAEASTEESGGDGSNCSEREHAKIGPLDTPKPLRRGKCTALSSWGTDCECGLYVTEARGGRCLHCGHHPIEHTSLAKSQPKAGRKATRLEEVVWAFLHVIAEENDTCADMLRGKVSTATAVHQLLNRGGGNSRRSNAAAAPADSRPSSAAVEPSRRKKPAGGRCSVIGASKSPPATAAPSVAIPIVDPKTGKALERMAERREQQQAHPLLAGWRWEIVGEPLLDLLEGKTAVTVRVSMKKGSKSFLRVEKAV